MEITLAKKLTTAQIWALSVGMVISGQYFGWNYSLLNNNISDIIIALTLVIIFYSGFMFIYTKLAIDSQSSGGIMAYIEATQKPRLALMAGMIALAEFFFAVAAIAIATGAYLHQIIPFIPPKTLSYICLIIITSINVKGISESITLEMITTVLAFSGLIFFTIITTNSHEITTLQSQFHLPETSHVLTAIPFLLWLFLGIEGSVLASQECIDPHKNLPRAIKLAMITLTITAALTVIQTELVNPHHLDMNNPLPSVLTLTHKPAWEIVSISILGSCGLLASFNGLLIAASRQLYGIAQRFPHLLLINQLNGKKATQQCLIILAVLCAIAINIIPSKQLLRLSICGALCIYLLGSLTCLYNIHSRHTAKKSMFIPLITLTLCILFIVVTV